MRNGETIAKRTDDKTNCIVSVYPHGTITDRGRLPAPASVAIRAMPKRSRSTITTLSKASAARLRRLLARIKGPEGWICFGLTLTVPGPPITINEWHQVWNAFRNRLYRMGNVALVWRIELQVRGQPHVHCICWIEKRCMADDIRICWLETLGLLGECVYTEPARPPSAEAVAEQGAPEAVPKTRIIGHRAFWPGADLHAVDIDGLCKSDHMGWWRYLAAHTSKSKQAQLGWKGRQWGVMKGDLLDLEEPVLIELPGKAADKVFRCLKRMTGCRFASSHGKQTWFVRPLTIRRLCDWATGNYRGMTLKAVSRKKKPRRKRRV